MHLMSRPTWRLLQRGPAAHSRCARALSAIAAHTDPTGLVNWVQQNGGGVEGVSVAAQPEPLGYGLVATEVCAQGARTLTSTWPLGGTGCQKSVRPLSTASA